MKANSPLATSSSDTVVVSKGAPMVQPTSGEQLSLIQGPPSKHCSGFRYDRNVDSGWWRKFWGASIPNKVKIHLWRACNEAIPMLVFLYRREVQVGRFCSLCHTDLEDVSHALWYCPAAQSVWRMTALWPVLSSFPGGPFVNLCVFGAGKCNKEDIDVFCIIAWCLRQNRNKLMLGRVLMQADAVVSWAGRFLGEFLTCNGLEKTTIPTKSPAKLPWQPPRSGMVKVNVDAAVHESLDVVGIGVVVRNEQEWTIETDAVDVIRAVKDPVPLALE
ncbi:hypothetical protein TIFTF001_009575 [Ficus carica]|uniref:Reverse transcriptase zinc-binding domain-containing protein n=1 Tax=Ficus carica TaxID=3494 RepID=A0AA88D1E8_FICCA|nr:hypothetical protein TIFTF001_009575 [Ficus carica]